MKYSLPILTAAVLLAASVGFGWRPGFLDQESVSSSRSPHETSDGRPDRLDGPQARELLREARTAVAGYTLQARVRQRVQMLGHRLIGSGSYVQMPGSPEPLFRMELKLQVGDDTRSQVQVGDGRFLWTRRAAEGDETLERIDLLRVQEWRADQGGEQSTWRPMGGAVHLLDEIDRTYQIQSARRDRIGEVPVWIVEGRWHGGRPESPPENWDDVPPQIPEFVQLALGREDPARLFPYRVDFVRDGGLTARLEFFEVIVNPSLDRFSFRYQTGNQLLDDITDQYLERLAGDLP